MTFNEYEHIFAGNAIGKQIDIIMRQKDINATSLSTNTGIDYKTLRSYILGMYVPKVKDLIAIANALGVSVETLLEDI